jgi:hypothetical protein
MRERVSAAGAERQCVPAAPIGRFSAARNRFTAKVRYEIQLKSETRGGVSSCP